MADRDRALITIRPGPVVHVWVDGREVARMPLDLAAACTLLGDLIDAVQEANRGR